MKRSVPNWISCS